MSANGLPCVFLNNFLYFFIFACAGSYCCESFSLVVASGDYPLAGVWGLLLLRSPGSRARRLQQLQHVGSVVVVPRLESTGSVVVVQALSCSVACGIFLDQGSNLCLLHWWSDSLPLSHQGNPVWVFFVVVCYF